MALKTLFNEVEFLAQYPMVGLAIADSTSPVPGYLFGEINAITYVNNGSHCKMLVNFLISRLNKDTPIVCIKVLKLLSYLVKNGHSQMVDEVRLHEVELKEARSFNGPTDGIHGSSFYEMIRKMAKELLEIIYAENIQPNEKAPIDNVALGGYGSKASSKTLSGFGYNVKTEKSVGDVVSEGFSSFVEKFFLSSDKETESQAVSHLGDTLPKYKPVLLEEDQCSTDLSRKVESSVHNFLAATSKANTKVRVHRPGRAGGGWESSSDEDEGNATPPLIMESSKESVVSVDSAEISKAFVECPSEVSEECKIVDEFTVNEPLTELSYSDIQQICKRCSSLNCDDILSLILNKLTESEEFVQLRALLFIEYLLFHDVVALESLLKIVLPNVQKFLEDDKEIKESVKIKSMKICRIIEILNKKSQQKFQQVQASSSEQPKTKS